MAMELKALYIYIYILFFLFELKQGKVGFDSVSSLSIKMQGFDRHCFSQNCYFGANKTDQDPRSIQCERFEYKAMQNILNTKPCTGMQY